MSATETLPGVEEGTDNAKIPKTKTQAGFWRICSFPRLLTQNQFHTETQSALHIADCAVLLKPELRIIPCSASHPLAFLIFVLNYYILVL